VTTPRDRAGGRAAAPRPDAGAPQLLRDDALWYKDAIIYQLHIKSFFDSNNDGIGDFPGLISKLDYIAELGVNTLWLLPFYPSPRLDDGYDIAEYTAVRARGSAVYLRAIARSTHLAWSPSSQVGRLSGRGARS